MTIRSRRRPIGGDGLDAMTDDELIEVFYFGNLAAGPGAITFRATPEDGMRARDLLVARGKLPTREDR